MFQSSCKDILSTSKHRKHSKNCLCNGSDVSKIWRFWKCCPTISCLLFFFFLTRTHVQSHSVIFNKRLRDAAAPLIPLSLEWSDWAHSVNSFVCIFCVYLLCVHIQPHMLFSYHHSIVLQLPTSVNNVVIFFINVVFTNFVQSEFHVLFCRVCLPAVFLFKDLNVYLGSYLITFCLETNKFTQFFIILWPSSPINVSTNSLT